MRRFDNVTVRNVGGTCRQGQSRLSPLHPFWIHGFKRHDPLARDGFELFPQRRLVVCDELSTLPPRLISTYRVFCGRIVWNRQRFIKDPDTGKRVSRPNPEEEWITRDVPELRIVGNRLWKLAAPKFRPLPLKF